MTKSKSACMTENRHLAFLGLVVGLIVLLLGLAAAFAPRPLETFAFYLFAGTMLTCSLGVALTGSMVRSAAWLLGALVAAAGLFILLAANFLAVVQLIVYAGGILVLIVFGIMLTARGPQLTEQVRPAQRVVATGLGFILFIALCALTLPAFSATTSANATLDTPRSAEVSQIGAALLGEYSLPFQMLALLLLAVMIGAAYLARPEKK